LSDNTLGELLKSEHVKYQDIDLGEGHATGGYKRNSLDRILFTEELRGQTLLDIGSSLGHFCLEALKHGAVAATGLETSPERIRHARQIAAAIDAKADYIQADFEQWDAPAKSFDTVLCLNVLHHLYDPVAAIRKMMAIARRRIYLEVAPVTLAEVRKVANPLAMWGASSAPIMLLGDASSSTRAADRTFTFTRKALSVIINGHSKAFEPISFFPSSFKGRVIVEAKRRQIGHLVVVAGVTGVGKSTFIERVRQSPELRERLGIAGAFEVAQANEIDRLRPGAHPTLIYHYDLLRPFDRPLQSHGRDPAFHLLASADRVTLVTLANRAGVLRGRLASPAAQPRAGSKKARARHEVILQQYANPAFLIAWYDAWLDAASRYVGDAAGSRRFLLTDDGYPEIDGRDALTAMLADEI
jgi:SAM-dependent methyltransferase